MEQSSTDRREKLRESFELMLAIGAATITIDLRSLSLSGDTASYWYSTSTLTLVEAIVTDSLLHENVDCVDDPRDVSTAVARQQPSATCLESSIVCTKAATSLVYISPTQKCANSRSLDFIHSSLDTQRG